MKLSACGRFHVLEALHVDREVLGALASWSERRGLRRRTVAATLGTLAALHLASAMALRGRVPELRLATHDEALAVAARAVGFTVLT